MIIIEDIDDIYNWDIGQLWNAMNLLEDEDVNKWKEELNIIKYGKEIKIPIIYFINNWVDEHPESKRVTIKGHGKFLIVDYYDEIDERCALMRQIIIDNQDSGTTQPRVM